MHATQYDPARCVSAMAASVGGLKALSVILGGLPGDFPAAIAIVMHLAPDHKSLLAEILNRRTHLVVKRRIRATSSARRVLLSPRPTITCWWPKTADWSFLLRLRKKFILPDH